MSDSHEERHLTIAVLQQRVVGLEESLMHLQRDFDALNDMVLTLQAAVLQQRRQIDELQEHQTSEVAGPQFSPKSQQLPQRPLPVPRQHSEGKDAF